MHTQFPCRRAHKAYIGILLTSHPFPGGRPIYIMRALETLQANVPHYNLIFVTWPQIDLQ